MKTKLIATLLLALTASAHATFIQLGQINLTGTFTENPNFDWNHVGDHPLGWFGTMTVQSATGIFLPYVNAGDNLSMSSAAYNLAQPLPLWTMDGFTFETTFTEATGGWPGVFCFGIINLSGNGFNPNDYPPFGAYSHWEFDAPPSFDTGPINLSIPVGYDNGHVSDSGSTIMFFGFGLIAIGLGRKARPKFNAAKV